MYIPPRRNKNT